MANITPAARSINQSEHPKPIPRSTVATLLAGAVIFGALAGLALWKGGGLSFKNAKFSYLGFGAMGAGSISLSAAAIVAICAKCVVSKDSKKKASAPRQRFTSLVAATDIPKTKFGNYTGQEIAARFNPADGKWEAEGVTIEETFKDDPDFLKSVILYLLCTTQGEWTRNWHISPQNLPREAFYTTKFIQKYVSDNRETENLLRKMNKEVSTQFVNHLFNKTGEAAGQILNQKEIHSLIPPECWPQDKDMPTDYVDAQIDRLVNGANTNGTVPFTTSFKFAFSCSNDRLKNAILDRLVHLENTNNLGRFPAVSTIPESSLPKSDKYHYSDEFIAAYLNGKNRLELQHVNDPKLHKKFIEYIKDHQPESELRIYIANLEGFIADRPFTEAEARPVSQPSFEGLVNPENIATTTFGDYTGRQIAARFNPADGNWEAEGVTIEETFKEDPDFLKSVILYLLCTTQGEWTRNWHISPQNLPVEALYTPQFMEKYLCDNHHNPHTLNSMQPAVRARFVDYIIHKPDQEADIPSNKSISKKQMLSLINPQFWPENLTMLDDYVDVKIDHLVTYANTQHTALFTTSFKFAFSRSNDRLKNAILDRLVHLENTNNLGSFPPVSTIQESSLPKSDKYHYSDEFIAAYLNGKNSLELEYVNDPKLRKKLVDYIIDHKAEMLACIDVKFWPENCPFTNEFLAAKVKVNTDFTNAPKAFKAAMIKYILESSPDDAGLISLEDWPEELDFSEAFLNGQLARKGYKLDPHRRDFYRMTQHIISRRPDHAHLIEPSNLLEEQEYSSEFKTNYLNKITPKKLAAVPIPLREEFILFMIENDLQSVGAISIEEWPKNKPFTQSYLKGLSDLQDFTLTQEQPGPFRDTMIDYIIGNEPKKAYLIAPSDLSNITYTEAFMDCYLSRRLLEAAQLEDLEVGIREQFINHILKNSPHFADRINLSSLTVAPSSEFIESFLGKNPDPDLENMNPDVKNAFENHKLKTAEMIVTEYLERRPQNLSTLLLCNQDLKQEDLEKYSYWIKLAWFINKCRREVAEMFLSKVIALDIKRIALTKTSSLVASKLPKDQDYVPNEDFIHLWQNQGAPFVQWIVEEDRFHQKPLLDLLYKGFCTNRTNRKAFIHNTLELLGYVSEVGASSFPFRYNDVGETEYRRKFRSMEGMEPEKLPNIINDALKFAARIPPPQTPLQFKPITIRFPPLNPQFKPS